MASHFSAIGLPLSGEEAFLALANHAANDAEGIGVPGGKYLRWASQSGGEIWLQLDGENDLIGMTPHYSGQSRVRIGITARVNRPDDTPLDGAFHGWAAPSADTPESGVYPFVFDTPEYCLHSALEIPSIVTAQIAAFAHEVALFDSLRAFEASQADEQKFASQSFIPSGLFSADGKALQPPNAYGIFTGHIVQAEAKLNEYSGNIFYWALVESLGGSFDVVIDPALVENEPQVGGVLSGSFWLSGRLVG